MRVFEILLFEIHTNTFIDIIQPNAKMNTNIQYIFSGYVQFIL